MLVGLPHASLEVLTHGARADQDEVVLCRQAHRDLIDEPLEVLEAVRLAGGLGGATPAVTDAGVMPHVARGSMMGRDLGLNSLEPRGSIVPAGDDRLA